MLKVAVALPFALATVLQGAPLDSVVDWAALQAEALNAGSSWTSFESEIPKQKAEAGEATVQLTIYNRAHEQIRLANCDDSVVVPAGGQQAVTLKGRTGYWVVPAEFAAWDCKAGPFDLFGVGADLTGTKLKMGVGSNVIPEDMEGEGKWDGEDEEENEEEEKSTKKQASTEGAVTEAPKVDPPEEVAKPEQETTPGKAEEKEQEEAPPTSTSVLGVALTTEEEGAPRVVACFGDSCTKALDLAGMPQSVSLHIIGFKSPQVANSKFLRSQNHGHWGGHHGHGHGHGHHGHGHWHGHHGHGHGHWHGHHGHGHWGGHHGHGHGHHGHGHHHHR